jgi:D-alanyl-D-alanine carboxypeptidase
VALDVQILDLPLSEPDVARYAGTYTYQSEQGNRTLRIYGQDGYLKAEVDGGKPMRLRYQGGHKFHVGNGDRGRLEFIVEDGRATGFTLHEGKPEMTRAERRP